MLARWLFFVLLILNAGYFLYQNQFVQKADDTVNQLASNKPEKTIVLLSEAIANGSARKIAIEEKAEITPSVDKPALCTKLTGFNEEIDAEQVQQRLTASSIGSHVQKAKVPTPSKFWVYIGPLSDRASAMREFRRLRAEGVDSYLVTDGELKNAISLGIFSRRALAARLHERHEKLGDDVVMKEVPKFRIEYQIHINKEDRDLFSPELWEGISKRYEFAEKHDNLCEDGVASRQQFP